MKAETRLALAILVLLVLAGLHVNGVTASDVARFIERPCRDLVASVR